MAFEPRESEFLNRQLLLRRVFLKLRQLGIHVVPGLCVGVKNLKLRLEYTWVIKGPRCDTLSMFAFASEESRTAFRTKPTHIVAGHLTRRAVIFRRAFRDFECIRRHVKNRRVSTTGHFLTIAAMTIEHYDGLGRDFVTNRPAGAPTGKRAWHRSVMVVFGDNVECFEASFGSRPSLHRFHLAITRWSVCDQRV
jgi:hypothetical protein